MPESTSKTLLDPASFGSLCSHELRGDAIISRLFGFFPIQTIPLIDVHYLRLATTDEVSPTYLFLNWSQFLPHRRSIRPVYILQTHNYQSIFLKLDGGSHFKLRQAIGRKNERQEQRLAA